MREELSEEARQLLRRIIERQAYRQVVAINMLGDCLKYVTDFDAKLRVAADLDLSLRLFREVKNLYAELGWQDLESTVRDRLEEVPFPESRLEFGVAHFICNLAQEVAMTAYVDSASREFGAIARSYVEAAPRRPEPARFLEFCEEPTNRPRAQELFNRWLAIALRAFGRPGTKGDERAVALGLRSKPSADMIREFVERLRPFRSSCGLGMPDMQFLGLDLPGNLFDAES